MTAPLTGRKVLLITVSAFGVIIGVNLLMAFKAISTFPGLEVANSYVASQNFDSERIAQEALGWVVDPVYADGLLRLNIRDAAGLPAEVRDISVLVGRPTSVRDDKVLSLVEVAGAYSAAVELAPGNWLLHLEAHATDGTLFRQRLDFVVKG
ncbi:MAG: FixH family protein [Phaeovulum sp.]|uniref:FixH family protein n=1 Tax=Phaeovulum sp. TaxID=2934796 RepID=UPI00272FC8EE|nr:FixH family protein [Phaeovulum sp.]MDP2061701.1 FixH family protein [Phaeovulum sp.]MDP3862630.1 FixH family protein [Phaeovulum sp.]